MDTVLVNNVTGTAWVRNTDGSLTQIQPGMRLAENAQIITDAGASVELQPNGEAAFVIGENREFLLSADVLNTDDDLFATLTTPDTADFDPVAQQVLAALSAGEDPFDILDPTAAMLSAAGGDDGGSSFTRLLSIIEATTPLALAYPRPGVDYPELPILGGVATSAPTAEGPAVQPPVIEQPQPPVPEEEFTPEIPVQPENPQEPQAPVIPRVQLAINNPLVSEGDEAVFNIDLSRPLSGTSTLNLQLKPGTAGFDDLWKEGEPREVVITIDGVDTTVPVDVEGKFTIDVPPQTTEITVKVPTYNDDIFEGEESFTLDATLTNTGTNSPSASGTGTIVDDGRELPTDPALPEDPDTNPLDPSNPADDDRPSLTIGNAETTEGGLLDFQIKLDNAIDFDSTVSFSLELGTASAADLWADPNAPFVYITTADDTRYTVNAQLDAAGNYVFDFPVDPNQADFSFTVSVPTIDDTLVEDLETLFLDGVWSGTSVAGNSYSVDADQAGQGTILDNDDVQLSIVGETVNEGDAVNFDIQITGDDLTVDTELTLKINFDTADINDLDVDANGNHYVTVIIDGTSQTLYVDSSGQLTDNQGNPATVTVPAGQTQITLQVPTLQDDVYEGSERFTVEASLAGQVDNRIINPDTVTGTGIIVDDGTGPVDPTDPNDKADDDHPDLSIVGGGVVAEGTDAEFTVTLSNPTKDPVTLEFDFQPKKDGNPAASLDDLTQGEFTVSYEHNGQIETTTISGGKGQVDIPGGVTNIQVTMPTKTDDVFEGAEGFDLVVTDKTGVTTNGSVSADAFIVDSTTDNVVESGVGKEADGSLSTDPNKAYDGDLTATGNVLNGSTAVVIAGVAGATAAADGKSWTLETEHGTVTIDTNGDYTYALNDEKADSLNIDDLLSDTITYTVKAADGSSSVEQDLTITITGTNDAPVITTQNNQGGVIEDDVSTATGQLAATDVDHDQSDLTWSLQDSAAPVTQIDGIYGSLTLNASTGEWEYTLDHTKVQHLGQGDTLEESFPVWVKDALGASDQTDITITITGTNDAPVAKEQSNTVTEAGVAQGGNTVFDGTPMATGNLLDGATDVDQGAQLSMLSVNGQEFGANNSITITTDYGTLIVDKDGEYTFKLDNNSDAVNQLAYGQSHAVEYAFVITDEHGATSAKQLTINIVGTNDKPEITLNTFDGGVDTVVEEGYNESGRSIVSGQLEFTDADSDGDEGFKWSIVSGPAGSAEPTTGIYGDLTLNADGTWVYTLDNTREATDKLAAGQTETETFTVRITDKHGAYDEKEITVQVQGTNDAPIINPVVKNEGTEEQTIAGNLLDRDHSGAYDPDSDLEVKSFTVAGKTYDFTNGAQTIELEQGTFTLKANGEYTFKPKDFNFSGTVPPVDFTIGEVGPDGLTTDSKLTITVTPVADAPDFEQEFKSVETNEDEQVKIGLKAPVVTDATDYSGSTTDNEDNPELLGVITLSGIPKGSQLLADGGISKEITGSSIKIVLTDGPHTSTAKNTSGIWEMTKEQFESLQVLPPAENAKNFTITAQVTSYEVDSTGTPLAGIDGATTTIKVPVTVLAVTDPISLKADGKNEIESITINEDQSFDLKGYLDISYPDNYEDGRPGDGNSGPDLDGSEKRWFEITGLPEGSTVNGIEANKDGVITIHDASLSTSAVVPNLIVQLPQDYSGTISGVEVTFKAQDIDPDSKDANGDIEESTVTIENLHVNPIAGDVTTAKDVTTNEDTAVSFMQSLKVTDESTGVEQGGQEVISAITITGIPDGWTLKNGNTVLVVNSGSYTLSPAEISAKAWGDFTLTPPAHSSDDATVTLKVTSVDTSTVDGVEVSDTKTTDLPVKITVKPVAERVGEDSDGDGTADLTMTEGTTYNSVVGAEEEWFALNQGGFDLSNNWYNQDEDGSEKTYAILTPEMVAGYETDTFKPSDAQFRYQDSNGEWVYVSYAQVKDATVSANNTSGFKIPVEFLGSVQFLAPQDVAGEFKIQVQAYTEDRDQDGSSVDTAISGEAWLNGIIIKPVADGISALGTRPASGNEDEPIQLHIRPQSSDASEIFNVRLGEVPAGAVLVYNGAELTPGADGFYTIESFDPTATLTITPPKDSNQNFTLKVQAQSVDSWTDSNGTTHTDTSKWENSPQQDLHVAVKGVADGATVTLTEATFDENAVDANQGQIKVSELVGEVSLKDDDGSETLTYRISGLPEGFSVVGATLLGGSGADRIWLFDDLDSVFIKVPEHFSGELPGKFGVVSTENDGDSTKDIIESGVVDSVEWLDFKATIKAELDGELSGSAVISEDVATVIDFADGFTTKDRNEELTSIRLSKTDIERLRDEGLVLLVNGKEVATDDYETDGYLVIASDAVVTAKNATEHQAHDDDGNALSFTFQDIQYVVTQTSSEGKQTEATLDGQGDYTLTIKPISDSSTLKVDHNELTLKSDQASANLQLTIGNPDTDGSESLTHIRFSGVPSGLILGAIGGVTPVMVAAGEWVYFVPEGSQFETTDFVKEVQVTAGQYLANGEHTITMQVESKDKGADSAALSNQQTVVINNEHTGSGGGANEEFTIDFQTKEFSEGTEDHSFALGDVIAAEMMLGTNPADASFSIVIKLPKGAELLVDQGSGVNVYQQGDQWIIAGKGSEGLAAALDANGIQVQPPADWNTEKDGSLPLDITFNASLDDGRAESSGSQSAQVDLTPVTDGATIDIQFSAENGDSPKEGENIQLDITLKNPVDAALTVDGPMVVDLGSAQGTLYFNGEALTSTNGVYHVPVDAIDQAGSTTVGLVYEPHDDEKQEDFSLNVQVTAGVTEAGATNSVSIAGNASTTVEKTNNGFSIEGIVAEGLEVGEVDNKGDLVDSAIKLELTGAQLNDTDEVVHSAMIKGLPEGFLVYVGDKPALNAGDGSSWLIQTPDGKLPDDISILPPQHWNGTHSVTLEVNSGESDSSTQRTDTFEFDLTVNAVADGVRDLQPDAAFGIEGELIDLNLNLSLKDNTSVDATDMSFEKAVITFSGLAEGAAFYVDERFVNATYENGQYIISGLTEAQANSLQVRQAADAEQLDRTVTVSVKTQELTEDGEVLATSESTEDKTFTLRIEPQQATSGDDELLYSGQLLDGLAGTDTVYLAPGYELDFDEAAAKLKNIEVIDLTRAGHDNTIKNLGLNAMEQMYGTEGGKLTIKANKGDEIEFVETEGWLRDEEQSSANEIIYYATKPKSETSSTGEDDGTVRYEVSVQKPTPPEGFEWDSEENELIPLPGDDDSEETDSIDTDSGDDSDDTDSAGTDTGDDSDDTDSIDTDSDDDSDDAGTTSTDSEEGSDETDLIDPDSDDDLEESDSEDILGSEEDNEELLSEPEYTPNPFVEEDYGAPSISGVDTDFIDQAKNSGSDGVTN